MDNIQIGRLIYEKRKELGLTQQELAERLQITNKAVSKWENGDGMPDVNLLSPLAAELGLTVDELLRGEKDVTENSIPENALKRDGSDIAVKDVVVGILACGIAVMYALSGFSSMFSHLMIFSDSFLSSLPYIAFYCYNIVFWTLVSAVFIRKFLRILDADITDTKGTAVAAFVVGLPMIYIQGGDTSVINYGCFFFILALLLSECHGYKIPHKIFYGLAILITVVYGLFGIAEQIDFSMPSRTDLTQLYGFTFRFARALVFYILYGVFEKCCDEYER